MQNNKKIILFGFVLFFSGFFGKIIAQESFYVYFVQNGKRINIKESKIKLKKQTFDIYVEYTAPMNLLVSASFDSKTWHAAKKGKLLYELPVFKKTEKKAFFDKKGTVPLSPETAFLWKKNQTDSSLNLKSEKGRRINIKKVTKVKNGSVSDIKNIKKDLYLVFIYAEKDKTGEQVEIQRELVKISWVKKYEEETKIYEHKKKVEAKDKVRAAKQQLKRKQKLAKKEEKRLKKLEKDEQKRLEKQKKKASKNNGNKEKND